MFPEQRLIVLPEDNQGRRFLCFVNGIRSHTIEVLKESPDNIAELAKVIGYRAMTPEQEISLTESYCEQRKNPRTN